MKKYRTREPNFDELVKVLNREKTSYPVLFEIFMDSQYYEYFSGKSLADTRRNSVEELQIVVDAFYNAGFDYASTHASEFGFPREAREHKNSISMNDGGIIFDEDSFNKYEWMNPESCDYSKLDKIAPYLPNGMKIVVLSPGGVLENVTSLLGYEQMCYMRYEEPELFEAIFDKVGSSLLKYYEIVVEYDTVGAIVSNDDWGFNTQTFLSTPDMQKYVFPWHKKIVETAHRKGKKAILHSCGYMGEVFDDIIDDMKFDGKHSYEDNILSVEDSYAKYGERIAILGGLDLDFLTRASLEEVKSRACALAEIGVTKGGYALGSGNSMCYYIPEEKAECLINVSNQFKKLNK